MSYSLPRSKTSVAEDKVEVSTETKSENRKGKKDINFIGQKFRAPGGNRTCVDRKGKNDINFGRLKFPAPGGTRTCVDRKVAKNDSLYSIKKSVTSPPFHQSWWPSGRALFSYSCDPGSNPGR